MKSVGIKVWVLTGDKIETAINIDVIHPDNPKKIISRIKRMFSRLHPDEMETSFMRGFLAAINKKLK